MPTRGAGTFTLPSSICCSQSEEMATLSPSLVIQSGCLNCGTVELSKLMATTHHIRKNRTVQSFGRVDMGRRNFYGEVAQNARKSPYQNFDLKTFAASQAFVDQTENLFTNTSLVSELKNLSTYLFRTETGGQMEVLVGKNGIIYVVNLEISSLQLSRNESLVLSWKVYRSNLSEQDSESKMVETPFVPRSFGNLALEVEFEAVGAVV